MGKKTNKSRTRKRMLARANQKRISSTMAKKKETREKLKATVGYIAHHKDNLTQLFTFQNHAWVFPDEASLQAVITRTGMDFFKVIPTTAAELANGMSNNLPYLLHRDVLAQILDLGGLDPLDEEHFNAHGFVAFNGQGFGSFELPEELEESLFGD